jgi:membrane protease YdiL (CAAX protease family)
MTTFDVTPPPPAPPDPPPPPRPFGAARAIGMFFVNLLGQFLGAIFAAIPLLIFNVARGKPPGSGLGGGGTAWVLGVAMIITAATVLLGARMLAKPLLDHPTADGIGTMKASRRDLLSWGLAGAVTAVVFSVLTHFIPPDPSHGGVLSQLAREGGIGRLVLALVALFIAPPLEEFLFRGLMYRGFANSWGPRVAAVLVTLSFVALHVFETSDYWPAVVAIFTIALVTLAARLRTGSLAAAMASHFAYNGVLVLTAYLQ